MSPEKEYLIKLSTPVANYLTRIDTVMKAPESNKRGRKIAELTNQLEIVNDCAMHFGLDYSFKKINKIKGK